MSRASNNVLKLYVRQDVERDFGAVDSTTVDSGAALQAALAWAGASANNQLEMRGANFVSSLPLVNNFGKVSGRSTLKFTGIGSTVDCLTIQSSASNRQAVWEGISINANNTGRHAIAWSGGNVSTPSCKYAIVRDLQVANSVKDGLHQEPVAASCWLESCIQERIEIVNAGRHGAGLVMGTLASTFNNKGSWYDIQVRGAGLVSTGYDLYAENNSNVATGKISGHNWLNFEFDAKGGAFHGPHSVYFNQLGSVGNFAGWQLDGTMEDTSGLLTLAEAVYISTAGALSHPRLTNEGISNYTDFITYANLTEGAWIFTSNTDKTGYFCDPNHKIHFAPGDNAYFKNSTYTDQIYSPGIVWAGIKERRQNLTNSAGTIVPLVGNNRVNLSANVTTITLPTGTGNELDGAVVGITFIQNGTGGFTVAGWPANVLLSGGSFTPTSTTFKSSYIELHYDAGQAHWYERCRTLNM